MSALVNNLLDMARIESGEVKLRRQWQPLRGGRRQRAQGGAAGARPVIASKWTCRATCRWSSSTRR